MLTPFEEYKNRVTYKGSSKREYVKTKVEESVTDLIENSQYGFTVSIDGIDHEVALLSTSTTQEYESANILAPLAVGLDRGVIFTWEDINWIVLQKMFRPDQPGFNGIAYKCTGDLKWIDEETHELHSQPAYIRSGRITNALGVTPDVNEVYDNLILHNTDWNMMAATPQNLDLKPEMRFIIKGQAYRISNVDNVSIDNVSIVSFAGTQLLDTDDLVNSIAYSDVYKYTFQNALLENTKLYIDDVMQYPITILEDGIPVDLAFSLTSSNPEIIEVSGEKIIGRGEGEATITCTLVANPTITYESTITIVKDHADLTPETYILGNDYIEWNSSEAYILSSKEEASISISTKSNIRYTTEDIIDENTSAVIGITISVKDKYSGVLVLTASTSQGEISKSVYIRTI